MTEEESTSIQVPPVIKEAVSAVVRSLTERHRIGFQHRVLAARGLILEIHIAPEEDPPNGLVLGPLVGVWPVGVSVTYSVSSRGWRYEVVFNPTVVLTLSIFFHKDDIGCDVQHPHKFSTIVKGGPPTTLWDKLNDEGGEEP